eukprot:scaffold991_cov128-Cylindrotheca_fusiformis.AAC.29
MASGEFTWMIVDSSVKKISARALQYHDSVQNVQFSQSGQLETIGEGAFSGCFKLRTMNEFPSTLLKIDDNAFEYCHALEGVLDFHEGLVSIGKSAFLACYKIHTIKVRSPRTILGSEAFSRCVSLKNVELPQGLQEIAEYLFADCMFLEHLKIPSTVQRIRKGAFTGCSNLLELQLPDHLKVIEYRTFRFCASLRHLRIPPNVTKIEFAAFTMCPRLLSLEIPEGLEVIQPVRDGVQEESDEDEEEQPEECSDSIPIQGCSLLRNFVIPPKQEPWSSDCESVLEGLEFNHIVDTLDELVGKLKHRFDHLPLHRVCYYQSYYPLQEAMARLQQAIHDDSSAGSKVDDFGMTPLHILSLSQAPKLSLIQLLIKSESNDILFMKDKFKSFPADYLCANHSREAISVVRAVLTDRIEWLGLSQLRVNLKTSLDEALDGEYSSRRSSIWRLCSELVKNERMEAISLLELALWKAKMTDEQSKRFNEQSLDGARSAKKQRVEKLQVDRRSCRISSGADIVIPNVVHFLGRDKRFDAEEFSYRRKSDDGQDSDIGPESDGGQVSDDHSESDERPESDIESEAFDGQRSYDGPESDDGREQIDGPASNKGYIVPIANRGLSVGHKLAVGNLENEFYYDYIDKIEIKYLKSVIALGRNQ